VNHPFSQASPPYFERETGKQLQGTDNVKAAHTAKLRSTLLTEDHYSVLARVSTSKALITESMRFKN
jgi:hypothetical protein